MHARWQGQLNALTLNGRVRLLHCAQQQIFTRQPAIRSSRANFQNALPVDPGAQEMRGDGLAERGGVQRKASQRTDWPLHFRKRPAAFHFRRASRLAIRHTAGRIWMPSEAEHAPPALYRRTRPKCAGGVGPGNCLHHGSRNLVRNRRNRSATRATSSLRMFT